MKLHSYVPPFLLGAAMVCAPLALKAQQQYPEAGTRTPAQTQGNNQNMSKLSPHDAQFVKEAAQGGVAEVELGRLAQQKASSEDVKKFGERMAHDHAQINKTLTQLAERDSIPLPKHLSAKDRTLKDRLEKLNGAQFDHVYMENMVKDHKQDISEFQHEARNAQNADVQEFAAQTLPTLKSHLEEAERVAPQQKASMNSGGSR